MNSEHRSKLRRADAFFSLWWVPQVELEWIASSPSIEAADELVKFSTNIKGQEQWTFPDRHLVAESDNGWIVMKDPYIDPNDDDEYYRYDPLEKAGLHRTFANLATDAKSITEFANTYGFLGRTLGRLDKDGVRAYWGESMDDWRTEIRNLRFLIHVWDLLQQRKFETLGGYIRVWRNMIADFHLPPEFTAKTDYPFGYLEIPVSNVPDDTPEAVIGKRVARVLLREHINWELESGAKAAIDIRDGGSISLIPKDLQGALYVHFAKEVIGQVATPRKCAFCEKLFFPKSARTIYCSDSCNFKAYRKRIKEKSNG